MTDYGLYPHLDRTEYLVGRGFAVEAYSLWGRDYFALANENSGLHIFQVVDDEVIPVGIGNAVGQDRDIAIKDWYAFVATGSGLTAINVAVPENPFNTDFVNLSGESVRVVLSGTHAFVANGTGGLVMLDITNPGNMFIVGQYGTDVRAVGLDGDRVGIINETRFELLDASMAHAPVLLGSLDLGSNYWGEVSAVLQGDLAYVSQAGSVRQLDISDPAAIAISQDLWFRVSQINSRLEIQGSELVFSGFGLLVHMDFATGSVKRESQQVGFIRDAASIAGKIMVASEDRLEIFEEGLHVNAQAGIVEDANLMEPKGIVYDDMLYGLSLSEENTLVATKLGTADGLWWNLDLETQGFPVRGMAHFGYTVATVTTNGILSIVTVGKDDAVLRSTLDLQDGFHTPYNHDRTVAFLDYRTVVILDEQYPGIYSRNIRLVDISNLEEPVQIGQYPITINAAEHLMPTGSLLVVSTNGGFEVFEAQDRHALQSLGVHQLLGNAYHRVYAQHSHLYALHDFPISPSLEDRPERLDVWDLANPVEPVLVHQVNLNSAGNLVFAGDWAYQGSTGLILDLSDPAHPVPAGNFSQPVSPYAFPSGVLPGTEYIVAEFVVQGNDPGNYALYLTAQGATGGASPVDEDLPASGHELTLQAVPNPFNPRVSFHFDLPLASPTRLEIYDLRGRLVADLGEKFRQAGSHSETWDGVDRQGRNLPSGVYLARVVTPTSVTSLKIVLAR